MTVPLDLLGDALAERYRVERELGAGGMATVYLAHDLKHDRKVAIKVLHPELAAVIGADRFLTEIRTTANLQHPHILPLFDSGAIANDERRATSDPSGLSPLASRLLFYVMPFVPGESLRQRLSRERQLPVADAVRIAGEVASALDYAHRQGVIHRDIKPENILLHDGAALVADFGIALAVTAAGGGRLTQTGLSLGTPAYMSPEQAMGERDIGPRTDVYALGAVTYEMLGGEPPFTGPTSQAIVARTLTESPRPLRVERKSIPPHVEEAVLTALEKLPADRYGSAREFAEALAGGDQGGTRGTARTRAMAAAAPGIARSGPLLRLLAGVAVVSTLAAIYLYTTRHTAPAIAGTPVEFRPVEMGTLEYFSVSADGQYIVGTAPDSNGVVRVLIRRLADAQVTAVPGTEHVSRAWLTPDNRALILRGERSLRYLPLAGGGARDLAPAIGYVTVEWARGDSLLAVIERRLLMIPLDGGATRTVAELDSATGGAYYIPRVLPGGRNILIGHRHNPDSVSLLQMDLSSGRAEQVHPNVQEVRPYAPDRLLWLDAEGRVRYGTYDQRTRRFGERQLVLAEGIDDLFANGDVVVLRPGLPKRDLWLMAAEAREPSRLAVPDTSASFPLFSPDGGQLALLLTPAGAAQRAVQSTIATHLWTIDRRTGLRRHLMDHASEVGWFPDGKRLLVLRTGARPDPTEVWSVPVDGSTPPERAPGDGAVKFQPAVTPDASGVVYTNATSRRLALQPFAPGAPSQVLFDDPGHEFGTVFSPDGRWFLYGVEDESGAFLIARAWPALDKRTVISPLGFCPAYWGDQGRRIYTCLPDGTLAWIGFDPASGRITSAPQPVAFVPQKNPEFTVNPMGTDLAWIPVSPRYGTEARVLANWRADAERRLAGE